MEAKNKDAESAKKSAAQCPCMAYCPLENTMRLIGGKWKTAILCALQHDGTVRYNELKRKIRGITNTMLASALRELEDAGLVHRQQFMEIPVRVEYSLTSAAHDLLPILTKLAHWGINAQAKLA